MAHRIYNPTTNMAMSTLQNVVLEAIAGNGTKVNQLRVNPTTRVVEVWNGSVWVAPSTAGQANGFGSIDFHGTNSTTLQAGVPNDVLKLNISDGLLSTAITNGAIDEINLRVDFDAIVRNPERVFHVSPVFPTVGLDEHHYTTIDNAVAFAYADDPSVPAQIIVHPGIYNINDPIPEYMYIHCMPGVTIFNSIVDMVGGGRWLGHANVGLTEGSYFRVSINPDNVAPVLIEGDRIRVLMSGMRGHIRASVLEDLVCSVSDGKQRNVGNFDVQVDVLELGNVYTTRVDIDDINMLNIVEPNFVSATNAYCACTWTNNVASCSYSQTCIMSAVGMEGAVIRDSDKNRLQIRCNKRYGKTMVSVGYVDILGERMDIVNRTMPSNYVTGIDLQPEKSSRLRINGFYERYDGALYPYQVMNDGVLILENCNIKNPITDGKIVVLSPMVNTGPFSHVSVNSSRLFSYGDEISDEFNTMDSEATYLNTVLGNGSFVGIVLMSDFLVYPAADWI